MARVIKATREAWLMNGIELLNKKLLVPNDLPIPPHVYVSVGFPKGARTGKAIGQCFSRGLSADNHGHIFISPELNDAPRVLDVLLHEVGHDVVGCEHGHKKPFADFCRKVGLVKPWTATTASPELRAVLEAMAEKLGPYPHALLTVGGGVKKQTTRMRKYQCPECDQIIRAATDDLDVTCTPCGCPFERS